jgi:cell division protein FtsB
MVIRRPTGISVIRDSSSFPTCAALVTGERTRTGFANFTICPEQTDDPPFPEKSRGVIRYDGSTVMKNKTGMPDMTIPLRDPQRRKRRLPLYIAMALLIGAVFISLFRDMGVVDNWRLRNTERQLRGEAEKLRQENAQLKRMVEDLRGNPSVIEQEARRLGLIKEGEDVIVVPKRRGEDIDRSK